MLTIFVRTLVVTAVLQFFITRRRAGNVIIEGEAEALWMRYPFNVLFSAVMWTLTIAAAGAAVRQVRRLR